MGCIWRKPRHFAGHCCLPAHEFRPKQHASIQAALIDSSWAVSITAACMRYTVMCDAAFIGAVNSDEEPVPHRTFRMRCFSIITGAAPRRINHILAALRYVPLPEHSTRRPHWTTASYCAWLIEWLGAGNHTIARDYTADVTNQYTSSTARELVFDCV
jgi:hypothetical protein